MKAISIMQPWADAIMHLGKNIENRTWPTKHRGALVIHCGKGWDKEGEYFLTKNFPTWTPTRARMERAGFYGLMWVQDVVLADQYPAGHFGKWAFGPWLWILADGKTVPAPRPLEKPIYGIGRLGLFDAPESIWDLEVKGPKK